MANEISIRSTLQIASSDNGLPALTHGGQTARYDQTNPEKQSGTIDVTTTAQAIDLTDLTTQGWTYVRNIDATVTIIVQASDGVNDVNALSVPPESEMVFKIDSTSSYKVLTASGTATLIYESYSD